MLSLTDTAGGLIAVGGVAFAAVVGWFGTRSNTNANFASDLIHELREDNKELRDRLEALEGERQQYLIEIADLKSHVEKCDTDYTEARVRIDHLERIIRGIFEKKDVEDLLREMFDGGPP